MIDEKKLIDWIDAGHLRNANEICFSENDVVKIINLQPKVGEWIPVSERLPDDYVKVLTCDAKGNIHTMDNYHEYKYPFCIPPDHTRYYMPVAWMPLPDPYKEKDGEEE